MSKQANMANPAEILKNLELKRPYLNKQGHPCVLEKNSHTGKAQEKRIYANAGALLQYDEWKDIDRTVLTVATDRLVGIADLMGKGLTHNLGSIGQTLSLWDKVSDMTAAEYSMMGVTEGEKDTPAYDTDQVPIPIVFKDFEVNFRRLASSRIFGEGIDVTAASIASRLVAEASEDMLFSTTSIKVGSSQIYGYLNYPSRNAVVLGQSWTDMTTAENEEILTQVLALCNALRADKFYGPYTLYVPGTFEGKLDEDFYDNGNGQLTVRQRILNIPSISNVVVVDRMATNNIVLVQMSPDVVDLAIAQGITAAQWSSNGNFTEKFKVYAVWAPRLKDDYDGRCGIAHGTFSAGSA